ncbi:TELO2-interacting protein 1 homolog isoform X2 [Maniola jurtina]|uniref:TELO2-interacting protein 1 homolog isoform X2 n=1 Tax=Maniola jurtina TaxID=191418 RepID=UPI001E688ADA|nr:TELO2-interacting protein 1 homolog isoform X2 [Maniola jurtina]
MSQMVTKLMNMSPQVRATFLEIKPVCDLVFKDPSPVNLAKFNTMVDEVRKDVVQEFQQYLMFPFTSHLQSHYNKKKYDLQLRLVASMKELFQRIKVDSYEMCWKVESVLLKVIFDKTQPGMIADIPEELKLSVVQCLTLLMLNLDQVTRIKMLEGQVPMLAQTIFVSVHLAKLEKHRALRLAALNCLGAHTMTHPQLTDKNDHITDPLLEIAVVNMMACILPGVLAALQDVATCPDNPGHAIVVAALSATHRVLCITMHNKHFYKKDSVTAEDFLHLFAEKVNADKDVSAKVTKPKDIPKRTPEWYAMASEKLAYVVKNLVPLVTHEHFKVRKELAVLCYRILSECSATMQPSLAMALDVLITLSMDPYKEVSEYCVRAVDSHFARANTQLRVEAVDSLCENFFTTLNCLPRILNNIDSSRKLSTLGLLYGYLKILCDDGRPQRLTGALSASDGFDRLCDALLAAADLHTDLALLTRHAGRDVTSPPSTDTPWCRLRHLDCKESERRLQQVCQMLGEAECAELFLDRLLELFHERRSCELVYIMNWVGSAPNSSPSLAKRIISTYIAEDIWYLPLEVSKGEAPVTKEETLDTSVYNPRSWTKDSVPGLYEGATETRYTDISYAQPRTRYVEPNSCKSIAEAQRNMAFSCLVTEGLGMMARRLNKDYQPYLLNTLCLILERVGSQYENLHLSGLKAINDVACAFDHTNVTELIAENADYFTSQITSRLKKAWNTQSALQILSVVMEYSDSSILDYMYGIVEDVLVQCCDKYYERHLYAYLQVFLTFVTCIRRWFLLDQSKAATEDPAQEIDIMQDVIEFANNKQEAARLLSTEEFEKESEMTVEEMYKEDTKKREEDVLDYDDMVAEESPPPPQHIKVTITILKRCINFIPSNRDESLLALRILTLGLPLLKEYENELLPLVHLTWSPLVGRFETTEPAVLRCAFDLFVVLAELSKDFLRSRAVRDVLQQMYKFLKRSAQESHLKDTGSAYRLSHTYNLQLAVLTALPGLVTDLNLDEDKLTEAMTCVQVYLSNKQPKPLQMLAVKFFKDVLSFNYGCAWYHLRLLCANAEVLHAPRAAHAQLAPVLGTPYETRDQDYDANVKLIFYVHQ